MAEIVNLRRVRKSKARDDKAKTAATNRAVHGRTAAERACDDAKRDRAAKALDQLRRER